MPTYHLHERETESQDTAAQLSSSATAEPREWVVTEPGGAEPMATVRRLQTGYLVTMLGTGVKTKRFRQIDALREAFGQDDATFVSP